MIKAGRDYGNFRRESTSSSVEHGERVVCKITRSDVAALNKTIELKIRQNERERAASMHAAAKCIVGIR